MGDPVLFHFHQGAHGLDEVLHGDAGDAQPAMGVVQTPGVAVRAEQLYLVIRGAVRLQTLKALLSVVKHRGRGVQGNRSVGDDSGIVPALTFVIVHDEHMIRKDLSKAQRTGVSGNRLFHSGTGDRNVQHKFLLSLPLIHFLEYTRLRRCLEPSWRRRLSGSLRYWHQPPGYSPDRTFQRLRRSWCKWCS